MPKDEAEQGGADERDVATPERALGRLREMEHDLAARRRREIGRAAVAVSGEVGYRKLTVQRILERGGGNRSGFYRSFADKADCYRSGYEQGIEELAERLLQRARAAPGWAEGLRAALEDLAEFLVAEPDYATGLLAQVHVAGGPAAAKRKEVLERLSRAVDGARRETSSRHSPPPVAAEFILRAIEESLIGSISSGEPAEFAATVPDLLHIAVSIYFGPEATE